MLLRMPITYANFACNVSAPMWIDFNTDCVPLRHNWLDLTHCAILSRTVKHIVDLAFAILWLVSLHQKCTHSCRCVAHHDSFLAESRVWYQLVLPMLLAMFTILAVSFFWTQYANPGIRKLAGVKTLLRNAADEMTLVLTDVEATQALSDWNPSVSLAQILDSLYARIVALAMHGR